MLLASDIRLVMLLLSYAGLFFRLEEGRMLNSFIVDCSQPSLFSYFYLMVDRADSIELRENPPSIPACFARSSVLSRA